MRAGILWEGECQVAREWTAWRSPSRLKWRGRLVRLAEGGREVK